MAWWNSLTEQDRRHWMRLAGDTGRVVDAWRAFKGNDLGNSDAENAPERRTEKPTKAERRAQRGGAQLSERDWRAGYAAAYAAKLAGKATPRAPHGVDGVSYASGAVEGAAAGERELTPKDVLIDLFGEELHPDPDHLASVVIQRLLDAGFEIVPYPKGRKHD